MQEKDLSIQNLSELRQFVYQTLCEQNDLEVGIFELTERILVRGGEACGIYFCLHGPRSVQLTAIWETDGNTIWFYGATGERLAKRNLIHTVELAMTAA